MYSRFKHPLLRSLKKDISANPAFDPIRRNFLKDSLKLSGGLMLGITAIQSLHSCNSTPNHSTVAIVGGGIAGLSLAYQLKKAGISYTLYEAAPNVGGRIKTQYNAFDKSLILEEGGVFIDSYHEDILMLIEELGLDLIENNSSFKDDLYCINNIVYTYDDCIKELNTKAVQQFNIDYDTLPEYIESGNVHIWELYDAISIDTYLRALDISDWFRTLLIQAFEAEFGLKATELSAMNFMTLFEPDTDFFLPYGENDKLYKLAEGNQTLCTILFNHCKDSIKTDHPFTAVSYNDKNGLYNLVFQHKQKDEQYQHPILVFALPYSCLKDCKIDIPISSIRKQAIEETLYGNHHIQHFLFHEATWKNQGLSGKIISNTDIQSTYPAAETKDGNPVVLASKSCATFERKDTKDTYPEVLKRAFPGAELAFIKASQTVDWGVNTFSKGSISCYGIGQWAKFYGSEEIEEGGSLFFIGEHVSRRYKGTMNGAVETANSVFKKIQAKMEPS